MGRTMSVGGVVSVLPRVVYQMAVHGGLIVGSQAKRMVGEVEVDSKSNSDWDVLVPFEKWQIIALLIPTSATPNKFGGWRFETEDGVEVDVWPGSVITYLTECKTKYGGAVYAVDYIKNMVYSSSVRDVSSFNSEGNK